MLPPVWSRAAIVMLLALGLFPPPAGAADVPSDTTLARLRASFGERGRIRLRTDRRWRERTHASVDSAGIWYVTGAMPGTRIRASLQPDERTRVLIPWSQIEGIQVPNPEAKPGTVLAISLGVSTLAGFLIPRSAKVSWGKSLGISAGVTAASMLTAYALTGGPKPDWVQAYPPETAKKKR